MTNIEILTTYGEFCEWAPAHFLIVSENVFDPLIYYSHLLPVLLAFPLAFFVLMRAPKRRLNQYLFGLVTLFSLWSVFDLVLWAHDAASTIMFFWSMLILLEPLIYFSALLFAYYALHQRQLSNIASLTFTVLFLPIIIFLPSTLAIESFNLTNCYREVTEGPLVFYGYVFQILISVYILYELIKYVITSKDASERKQPSVLIVVGILFFLLVFSSGNIIGSFAEDWTIGQYGIFGMPLLVAFLGYVITRYQTFKSKIISTEILVGALAVLIASMLFIESLDLVRTVVAVSFVLVVTLGFLLIRSVRREVEQRKKIEGLVDKLRVANKRLRELDQIKSEFVSIASHQLRSPLTSIRGYTSMILEGSYGKIPKKAQGPIEHIHESSRYMALSIEDFLNVSRIESGKMKYVYSTFNLKELATDVADETRNFALKKGLPLTFRSRCRTGCMVRADIGKVRQVLHNLIDNAIKYTPKGTVTVVAHDNARKRKVYISVKDTGIGMNKEALENIFEKFVRAKNANSVNVTGSGLGLYVAKQMVEEMGGAITATSEGAKRGSTFTLELPLVKKKK